MTVLSVTLPASREATLALSCLKHGVEATKIDTDGGVVYADLTGSAEKTIRAALGGGARPVAAVEYEEVPGIKSGFGQNGEGIMLDSSIDRLARYGALMAGPR